jgi:hypothetical protein
MTETIQLQASDGHRFDAYRARPADGEGPGLVVIQEIFGVNPHIRSVADRFAAQGVDAVAPALFDRVRPGIELGYEAGDIAAGREIRAKIETDDALKDVAATVKALAAEGRKVGVSATAGAARSPGRRRRGSKASRRRSATTAGRCPIGPTRPRAARSCCISAKPMPRSRSRRSRSCG